MAVIDLLIPVYAFVELAKFLNTQAIRVQRSMVVGDGGNVRK